MGKYIVKYGQNIYDVALHIYGSIEGIVDLMMNNPTLSLADTLRKDQELEYTDGFLINSTVVAWNKDNNITPANGMRHVYYKEIPSDYQVIFELVLDNQQTYFSDLILSPTPSKNIPSILVDWGDNSNLEEIQLNSSKSISHSIDSVLPSNEKRKVRIYSKAGNLDLNLIRIPNTVKEIFFLGNTLSASNISCSGARFSWEWIRGIKSLQKIQILNSEVTDLSALVRQKYLTEVKLTGSDIRSHVLDDFFIRLCHSDYIDTTMKDITLTVSPSGTYQEPKKDVNGKYIYENGMEAIWVLTHEPEWNTSFSRSIKINNNIYQYSNE